MSKITLADLVNLQNENTAVAAINSNNAILEAALENTLSRDGTAPNQMQSNLDMNSFSIINLPAPRSDTEPLRFGDLTTLGVGISTALMATQAEAIAGTNNTHWMTPLRVNEELTARIPISVKQFGAVGDGVTNDTVAVQAAITASATREIYFPAGVYSITHIDLVSNTTLKGDGMGNTTFRCRSAPSAGTDWIYGTAVTNVSLKGITFDGNNNLTNLAGGGFPFLLPCIHITGSSQIVLESCEFIKFTTIGFLTNTTTDILIRNNRFTRTTASTGVGMTNGNFGLAISGAAVVGPGAANNFHIDRNVMVNCQISVSGYNGSITNNDVSGWGFSAGINTQALASNFNLYIAGNKCHDSNQAIDQPGGYFPAGIENWAHNSTIVGNICYGNFGSGIDNGGADCAIIGNNCYNNGTGGVTAGINLLAQDATFKASGCIVAGNRCMDTRVGGAKTQAYGYFENPNLLTNSATGIVVGHNHFEGNLTAPMSLITTGTMAVRNSSLASTINIDGSSGFSGGIHQGIVSSGLSLINNGFQHFINTASTFTANRTLTLNNNNADRTISLSGNLTLGGTLTTANALTTSGAFALTLTTTNTTNATIPAGTVTLVDLASAQALTSKTYNGNTWTAGTGTLTIAAGKTATHNATTTFAGTDGKTLTISNSLTLSGTDGSTLNMGTGGTLGTAAYVNTGTSGGTLPLLNATGVVADSPWTWGTGTGSVGNNLNGGTGNGQGCFLSFKEGGTAQFIIGSHSAIFGGADADHTPILFATSIFDVYTGSTQRHRFSAAGGLGIGTTSDPGLGMIYTNAAAFMNRTKTSWTNGAAAAAGTLANAPAAGNPTKWIPVDDNGTTRYIPAW